MVLARSLSRGYHFDGSQGATECTQPAAGTLFIGQVQGHGLDGSRVELTGFDTETAMDTLGKVGDWSLFASGGRYRYGLRKTEAAKTFGSFVRLEGHGNETSFTSVFE